MAKRNVAKVKETYPDFRPLITDAQCDDIEKAAHGFGINRRILLASLRRSRAQLIAPDSGMSPKEVGEALLQMIDAASEYEKHLSDMQEMAKTAQARLFATAQTMIDRGLVE